MRYVSEVVVRAAGGRHEERQAQTRAGENTRIPQRARQGLAHSVLVLAILLGASLAQATEGILLVGNSAIRRGTAGAGVAAPRDAEWMRLNPASIVELDKRVDINLATLHTDATLRPGGVIGNWLDGSGGDNQYFFVPSAGLILPTDKGSWGFGVYAPSGVGLDFPNSRNILSRLLHGNADRRLEYMHARIIAAYAYDLGGGWSLGASVNASISRFRTDHLTLSLTSAKADYDWDTALGFGFGLGVHKQWDRLSLGLGYQSRQWSEKFDKYADLASKSIDLPQIAQAGLAYAITPRLDIMADYRYVNWGGIPIFAGRPIKACFGRGDEHIAKLGLEWRPKDKWTLRAGYSHSFGETITDKYMFMNVLIGTTTEDHLGCGVSYALNEHSEFHLSYMHTFDRSVTDSGEGDIFSKLGAGTKVSLGVESVTVGYTYKF